MQKHDNLAFSVVISSYLDNSYYAKMEFEIPFQFPKLPVKARLLELQPRTKMLESRINETLNEYPRTHLDETAITEVLAIVEQYINDTATSYEIDTAGMSLEQERAHKEGLARDHAQEQREHELRKREEENFAREERLKEAVLKEKQRRHGQYSQDDEEIDPGGDQDVSEVPFRFKEPISWYNPIAKQTLVFAAVFGPIVLLKRRDKTVTQVHPVKFGKMQQGTFLLKEIFLPDHLASKYAMECAMDQIRQTLEDCKSTNHPHVVKVHAYQIEHDTSPEELSEWKITILTEWTSKNDVRDALKISGRCQALQLRLWAEQALQALDFLEKLGHPHPAVQLENMLFFESPNGTLSLKMADGYGAALRNLVEKARDKDAPPEQTTTGWIPPELIAGGEGRTSKTCIWQFGVVVIKMAFMSGLDLENVHTSVEPLLVRDDLQETFKNFLRSIFQSLPRKRPSPTELLSHKFFKEGSKGLNIPTKENPEAEPHLQRSGDLALRKSQWHNHFIEPTPLGKGGFGQVFKARYLIDNQFYAIKRLVCTSRRDLDAIWGEVRLLAKVNHPGVVRYFNAWQEDDPIEETLFQHPPISRQPAVHSVRNRLLDPSTMPSTEHDFMDPSIHRNIGPEYDSDDEDQNQNGADDESSDSDDDDNMFGYQSPPEDIDDDDEAFDDDPFTRSDSFNNAGLVGSSTNDALQNIQFGDNTSSASKDTGAAVGPRPPSPVRQTPQRHTPQRSTLYIQMELCQTGTLKELILDGLPSQPSEVWRLFRDILEGLAHIHSHGVVHRDLKPTNIFIDSRGRTKIGDFGLAITSHVDTDLRRSNKNLIAGSEKGVGTQWYVAPELDEQGSGEYSYKADMFSLGVILFQMCMPIKTESERRDYLSRISGSPDFQIPSFFQEGIHQAQGRIIASLINHDQKARPSAQELLRDPSIPENLEDGTIDRYLSRLAMNDPEKYADLINNLYEHARDNGRAKDLAWQNRDRKAEFVVQLNPVTFATVNDQLRDIFRRHAAVESERNFAFPAANFYSNPAEFMDDNIILQLPFDLTLPFARMLADPEERPLYPKSYCFGTVYRRAHRGIAPTRFPEVDYDHVSSSAKDLSLKDAEVIKVLDEVLTEHTALAPRSFTIIINHGDLLDIILQHCQISEEYWDDVKRELSQLNVRRIEWKYVRDQLLNAQYDISLSSISSLERFNFQGDITTVRKKVNRILNEEYASQAVRPFGRLEEVMLYTERLGVKTNIEFSPLSNNTEQLYRGSIMFKAVENKSKKILAVGGRYDRLIEELSFDTPKGSVRAVGFRINVSVLNAYVMAEDKKRLNGKLSSKDMNLVPSRVDVVVTSFDETTLRGPCLEIYKNLLACGIKVELSEHYDNMAELDRYYGDQLNYWLVIVRPGYRIKVRNLSRDETDVRPSELVAFIKSELAERSGTAITEPKLKRVSSSHGDKQSTQRVSVCVPSHKDKKANRSSIVDAAAAAAQELAEELGSNAPIIAISIKDDILELMRSTRLRDDASWKVLRQAVPAIERQYLSQVQELLAEKAEEGERGAFVVNYRTNSCFFYDFGKKA